MKHLFFSAWACLSNFINKKNNDYDDTKNNDNNNNKNTFTDRNFFATMNFGIFYWMQSKYMFRTDVFRTFFLNTYISYTVDIILYLHLIL